MVRMLNMTIVIEKEELSHGQQLAVAVERKLRDEMHAQRSANAWRRWYESAEDVPHSPYEQVSMFAEFLADSGHDHMWVGAMLTPAVLAATERQD